MKNLLFITLIIFLAHSVNGQTVITPAVNVAKVNNGTGGGPLGRSGGVTFTFSKVSGTFAPCTYWGFQAGLNGDIATNMRNSGPCTFSGSNYYTYSTGNGTSTVTLTGSSTVQGYTASGSNTTRTVNQRAYVTTSTGTFILLSGDLYVDVSGLSSFSITVRMEGYGPSMGYNSGSNYNGQWRPIVQLFDGISTSTSYNVCTSFDSEFYAYSELSAQPITGGITPICPGSSTGTLNANYMDGSANIGYQWYVNGSPVPGATASSYNAPAISASTTYRVDITDSCLIHSSYSKTVSSPNFVVNMTASSIVSGTSSPNQSICYNGVPNTIYTAGYTGGTVSKWQVDDNATFTSPTDIVNITDSVTSAQILSATGGNLTASLYVRAIISGGGCTSGSAAAVIYVNEPNNITVNDDTANCTIDGTGSWIHFYNKSSRQIIASINSNGQNLGSTEVKVYQHGGNSIFANTVHNCLTKHAVLNRSFVVDVTNQPSSSVNVRLYFTDAELAELIDSSLTSHNTGGATSFGLNDPGTCENDDDVLNISDLVVTQVSGAINEDGNFDANDGDFTVHTTSNNGIGNADFGSNYVEFTVDNFSEFWIHGSETLSALPLDLLNFTAELKSNKQVALNWNTSNEIDVSHFVIERQMEGHTSFESIAQEKATGNSNTLQNYQHIDPLQQGGRYYYRLKSVNNDGTEAISSIRTVLVDVSNQDIQFTPNPVEGKIKISISNNEQYSYRILDVKGRVIQKGETSNQSEINTNQIAAGTYTIQFTQFGTLIQTSKLSIVK